MREDLAQKKTSMSFVKTSLLVFLFHLCFLVRIQDRIGRKDELLQGYENDLAKLHQAETLAEKRGGQVDSLAVSSRQVWH